jgi:hypothetical protein
MCVFVAVYASAQAAEKILLGPHIGHATIISITGLNSDNAIIRFRREPDDEAETCVREHPEAPSTEIAACVKSALAGGPPRLLTRRAFCSRSTLYTEFGNYSMVNTEKEKETTTIDGKPYRPVRTDWMDHRTNALIGNCSACNTPVLIDTFKVLCPVFYSQLFVDGDPY